MATSKFRLFGGPNASGKTDVFEKLKKERIIHTEVYVNADRIEKNIRKKRKFYFSSYRVKVTEHEFKEHVQQSGLFQEKITDKSFIDHFSMRSGILHIKRSVKINSYHASFIATYLAAKLFETRQSFTFETVMAHPSKADLLDRARSFGYKTYFYFVFTDDLDTNLARARLRELGGGHKVLPELVVKRATRIFKLLPQAFVAADSAYVIDNSDQAKTILKKENGILYKAVAFPDIIQEPIQKIIKKFSGTLKDLD
jgi:predicted ABC-type ATPase